MSEDLVLNFVIESISESSGLEEDSIQPGNTLFKDLGLTSIDMVEIFYMIEMEYDISLKTSDFEKGIKKDMDGDDFEIDNIITTKGLAAIQKRLPDIKSEDIKPGLTVAQLVEFITVQALSDLVTLKINP